MAWSKVKSEILYRKPPTKTLVEEMKQRPQNEYNDITKQSALTNTTTNEGAAVGSNEIDEKVTN